MKHPILLTTRSPVSEPAPPTRTACAAPAGVTEGVLKGQPNACPANNSLGKLEASPAWSGWGGAGNATNNARFQTKANAGLTAADVPKLKLKWSFGIPDAKVGGLSSPSPLARVFVGGDNGVVYSSTQDRLSLPGAYQSDMLAQPVHAPIVQHHLPAIPGTSTPSCFVTSLHHRLRSRRAGRQAALKNADQDGPQQPERHGELFYDGLLYVPMSGTETLVGGDLDP